MVGCSTRQANDQQALSLEKKMAEIRSKHLVEVGKITAQTKGTTACVLFIRELDALLNAVTR
jgi:hypothetical protein